MLFVLIIFLFIGFFILLGLIFLPFQFALYSIFNIITIPFQLIKIAFNQQLRVNHALEHATINVIESQFGCLNLSGLGKEDGFIIQGPVAPGLVEEAARVGLMRLQQGEHNLAIHKRCGTSILAANLVASVLFIYILWVSGYFGILFVLLAILAAQFLGPPLGWMIQKYITTSTEVRNMEIIRVELDSHQGGWGGLFAHPPGRYFIRTRKLSTSLLGY